MPGTRIDLFEFKFRGHNTNFFLTRRVKIDQPPSHGSHNEAAKSDLLTNSKAAGDSLRAQPYQDNGNVGPWQLDEMKRLSERLDTDAAGGRGFLRIEDLEARVFEID